MVSTRKAIILALDATLIVLGMLTFVYLFAPMFVQFGDTHYLAGGEWYTRVPGDGYNDYKATHESLWTALANDPNPLHWFPVTFDLMQ